jgi:hypothetical protein
MAGLRLRPVQPGAGALAAAGAVGIVGGDAGSQRALAEPIPLPAEDQAPAVLGRSRGIRLGR